MSRPIISRDEAREAGYQRYFTGDPCMRGHVAERHVSNTRCVECHRNKAKERRDNSPSIAEKRKASAAKRQEAKKTAAKHGIAIVTRQQAVEIGLKRFFTGAPCAKGHISERRVSDHGCVSCGREKSAKFRAENPEKSRRKIRESYQRNIEKQRAQAREYMRAKFAADPEAFRAKQRNRRATDPVFAFKQRARQMVRSALLRAGYRKASKTEALLGCTLEDFRKHIERQFLPGMGWHNMNMWEIDHIIAMANASTQEEAEALNKFTNLRPLWRIDNRSKHAKTTHLL